ncbi:hypothetical protein Mycsm_07150 (plasmid) [Mycobacterium sp. JS623]|uniref:hypothetical protein n=1 Tax=Mycobacterium sp. JS623 TaxID=212767 RepID=UPI0002A5679F|nr:hypothetical protein [Mycobacterium sp. JS623]AGB27246.1 hypothetical protein Mycsm_07150 [Mycobacterium sp. JS623]
MPRRSPWLDDRTELLISQLTNRHHLPMTDGLEDAVRHDISDHLDFVARMMRIGRQAAKVYVTDEVIGELADRIAAGVAEAHGAVDLATERRKRRR